MARSNIIASSDFVQTAPAGDGVSIACLIHHVDYLGNDYHEVKNVPDSSDLDQVLADSAVAFAQSLVDAEAGGFANSVLWQGPGDDVAVPADADLLYAQRVEVAAALRAQYAQAQYNQLINTAAALASLTVAELEVAFDISDASEIVTRVTRQRSIRDSLANESGE